MIGTKPCALSDIPVFGGPGTTCSTVQQPTIEEHYISSWTEALSLIPVLTARDDFAAADLGEPLH